MKLGGLIKFTLIDFPGRLVYPHLFLEPMPEEDLFAFLKRRQGTLEGVVITGGEPTLHEDILDFTSKIKNMGFAIKWDTNGTRPDVLREAYNRKLLDYVAMDLKAPLEKYSVITGVDFNPAVLKESMKIIKESGIPYQFRTTYDKEVLTDDDIAAIRSLTDEAHYRVQECLPVAKEKAALKVMHQEL